MVKKFQNLLFGLDVSIETCAENSFFFDSFQGKIAFSSLFLDQVNLSKSPLSYLLVKLETCQSDCLNLMLFLYKLVHLENVLLSRAQLFLLFLLLANTFLWLLWLL